MYTVSQLVEKVYCTFNQSPIHLIKTVELLFIAEKKDRMFKDVRQFRSPSGFTLLLQINYNA